MSDPSLVWMATRRLAMTPPNGYAASSPRGSLLLFHRYHRLRWDRTDCGIPMDRAIAIRRDTAELIADPCRVCWGKEGG